MVKTTAKGEQMNTPGKDMTQEEIDELEKAFSDLEKSIDKLLEEGGEKKEK